MMVRNGVCKRRVNKILKKKERSDFSTSIQSFHRMVQKLRTSASKILVMNETGIWSDNIFPFPCTYIKKRSTNVGVIVSEKKVRRTIVAILRDDGSTLRAFWIKYRNDNKRSKQKAIKGMNTPFILKYIDDILAPNTE